MPTATSAGPIGYAPSIEISGAHSAKASPQVGSAVSSPIVVLLHGRFECVTDTRASWRIADIDNPRVTIADEVIPKCASPVRTSDRPAGRVPVHLLIRKRRIPALCLFRLEDHAGGRGLGELPATVIE